MTFDMHPHSVWHTLLRMLEGKRCISYVACAGDERDYIASASQKKKITGYSQLC